MDRNVLATAKFVATCKDEKYIITLDLVPSGCTNYGNKHALIYEVFEDGKRVNGQCFDARYDRRFNTEKTFYMNALGFVKDQLRDDLVVEQIG